MAGFRGILDGSVEIGQAREARATQERMQQRQISAQMQMQAAQMQMQAAQLKANIAQANADRELKAKALNAEIGATERRIGVAEGLFVMGRE